MLDILAQGYQSSSANNVQQATPVVFAGMSLICVAIAGFIGVVLHTFVWGTIFKKAGYSFWMSLLMLIPLVNLVWFLVFVFSKWPIETELEMLRGRSGMGGGYGGGGFPVAAPPVR